MQSDIPNGFEERLRQRAAAQKHPLQTIPADPNVTPRGVIPNTPLAAATISFVLGSLFALGCLIFISGGFQRFWWATPQLGFFIAAWSAFHWGEFAVTAGWNLSKCSVDSFLLENGAMYHVAHAVALSEYLISLWLVPSWKTHTLLSLFGVACVVSGQALRSAAMIHAGNNFSHAVAYKKEESHVLVSDGIYAWFRHPSYAGFFYWALGTQLVLQNPISFCFYSVVLWRFFYHRIRSEESALVRFFGDAYNQYRSKVGTKIPFIP